MIGTKYDKLLDDTREVDITTTERNATLNETSTALVSGCQLSINADPTKFDISAGVLQFSDSYTNVGVCDFRTITYAGSTGNTVTNLATQDATYITIHDDGSIHQHTTKPSGDTLRDHILVGALVHTNRTSITGADSNTLVMPFDVSASLTDISQALGPINSGNLISGNVTNGLRIDKSNGYITQTGVNWINDKKNPNILNTPASTGASFLYTWRDGVGGWTTQLKTDIIPGVYDNNTGGATQPSGIVANNKWSIKKVYYLTGQQRVGIQFGQVQYASEAEAEANKDTATSDNPALGALPFLGWLLVRGAATDLKLAGDATFISAGKLGSSSGAGATGSSTTTLQGAYNNSTQPQVTTDSTRGSVQVKRGSAADTDTVFEVLNGAGASTANIKGDGTITGSNLSGTNTGNETATTIGALIGGAGDATPNDTDYVATSLTAAGILKKITWTNVKAFLKTYFDTLYVPYTGASSDVDVGAHKITTQTIRITNLAGVGKHLVSNASGDGVWTTLPTYINTSATAQTKYGDFTAGNLTTSGTVSGANVSATGSVLSSSATGGIGYKTGAGSTVTQATNKATGVTLNTVTGQITMKNAALAAGTIVSFTLTDSAIAATDMLVVQHISAGTVGAYTCTAKCAAGSAVIYVRNNTGGSLSEAIVLKYILVKSVTA